MNMSLDKLFSSFTIGTLETSNRIVMAPMGTNYATPEGFVTDRQIAYYVERAKGGVGYITVENTAVLQQGRTSSKSNLIISDEHAAEFGRLIEAVHRAGGKIVIQLNHAGRQTSSKVTGLPIVGPSPLTWTKVNEIPKELDLGEIAAIAEAFGTAAQRAKNAGADGIELHMAHGYLIGSFMSPFSNRRTDRYGGDIEGRSRFAGDVLDAVRSCVGAAFPVICRVSGDEYVDGGLKIEETRQIAQFLARNGAGALHVSACIAASGFLGFSSPYYVEEGVYVHLAEAIKSAVHIPVIAVGRIRNPIMADQIIRDGKADLVAMGRTLIADPYLPKKAQEGRFEDIVPCLSCNRCNQTQAKDSIRCAVNPEAGNEARFKFSKTDRPKKVWVVGGGPAGLKAAEVATLRGHAVTLFEKDRKLGGRMRIAAIPPKKAILNDFLDYLDRRVRELGITLEMGREFTSDLVRASTPDVVIMAPGGQPCIPEWKGIKESGAIHVDAALTEPGNVGASVLIIGGGGIGAETADHLSEMGKKVTLAEMLPEIASDLVIHLKYYLSRRLGQKGVTILTSTKVKELGKGYALVEDASGTRKIEGFETIVLAVGSKSDDRLAQCLDGRVPELYVIGDASKPREGLEAVYEGEEIAIKI
jgi:2,4-dienoyl-CoA reductase-like NADH-dependent reductase (Old Yellow Enzyme family)